MDIQELIRRFILDKEIAGYSPVTLKGYHYRLRYFTDYLQSYGIDQIEGITVERLRDFQEYFAFKTTRKGCFWDPLSRNGILSDVRIFLRWLKKVDLMVSDLSEEIVYAKAPQRLPQNILTLKEMEKILDAPDKTTHKGYRDWLLLELLYATGIRLKEVRGLELKDLDREQGTLHVREGKGNKERMVPLGKGLCQLLDHYIILVRPHLLSCGIKTLPYLFPGRKGPASGTAIEDIVSFYGKKAKVEKRVFPHAFRHACATHMLQNGAPLRHVQELLGHARIDTTQIYAHVTIADLKKAHARYHPREKMLKAEQEKKEKESCK